MKLTELFLGELDREAKITRRALERVPEGRDDWKPHDKSMPLGRLASLVAMMPSWITMMIDKDELDLNPPGGSSSSFARQLRTTKDLMQALDEGVSGARTALQRTSEEHLMKPWRLLVAGKVVAEQPRHIMLRDSINHLAHHRGQLTVYLRLNDVPVPAMYGPSADDQRFD
ncbi:MAG: DinB family protein [Acidobacteria bacterium]|nr:DinB family protein [Acidobacteriota bacterium]MCA1649722.1 DinB family protein [Acidobacteriota bacterium]